MTATISRRGFVQAVGALAGAGLLPSWRQFRQRRTIDLAPFCYDYDDRRYQLSAPFAQQGMVYATDGAVCVRTTLADDQLLSDGLKLPPASTLPWWDQDQLCWQPWPKQRLFEDGDAAKCPMCHGRGRVGAVVKCATCGGDGEVVSGLKNEDDGPYMLNCRACKGTGFDGTPCDYCESSGYTDRPALQRIGELVIAGTYDARIRSLGDAELALIHSPTQPVSKVEHIIAFRGDGFEGLLMPMFDRG